MLKTHKAVNRCWLGMWSYLRLNGWKISQVVGRIHFLMDVGMWALVSFWLSSTSYLQLPEAAWIFLSNKRPILEAQHMAVFIFKTNKGEIWSWGRRTENRGWGACNFKASSRNLALLRKQHLCQLSFKGWKREVARGAVVQWTLGRVLFHSVTW